MIDGTSATGDPVMDWLLDADPAIRWQTERDLLDAPAEVWQAERTRLEQRGWGAELLSHQDGNGLWAGGTFFPVGFGRADWEAEGQPWTATAFALQDLREFGLDPASEAARRTVRLVGENGHWDYAGEPFWQGEVEPCINGRTAAQGAYFGVDVAPLVERLVAERLEDGGWNCETENGSVRSSFHTTINVLEGLAEFERATGGTSESRAARRAGEGYLLDRHLFRRLSTGQVADPELLSLQYPFRWRYDVLRGLDYFRFAATLDGAAPDERLGEALARLRARRLPDGRWPLDSRPRGRQWFELDDGPGRPSRWNTLRALRVLRWAG